MGMWCNPNTIYAIPTLFILCWMCRSNQFNNITIILIHTWVLFLPLKKCISFVVSGTCINARQIVAFVYTGCLQITHQNTLSDLRMR